MELTESSAFAALRALLAGDGGALDWEATAHPAFERMRRAMQNDSGLADADFAALIRHALRFETLRRGPEAPRAELQIPITATAASIDWSDYGIDARRGGEWLRLGAIAWRPSWLDIEPSRSVDDWACSERVRRTFRKEPSEDSAARLLGVDGYRSRLQRNAVRAAMRTPPASTLLITLATGEGKSLVPYAIARVGFDVSTGTGADPGVTLVVVPTVTLAIDQEKAANKRAFVGTLAYRAGEVASNAILKQKIRDGSQAICFASPEAICGPLRGSLEECAQAGRLRAIVVDEAHLVDAWGTGFRTEFQLLGGLRRELIRLSPDRRKPRTILLTATLTSNARQTLRTLFSENDNFKECDGAALRPEPEYWVAQRSTSDVREARVLEAIRHLPRPMILYVTKVDDAIAWASVLHREGHRRLAVVHGKTSTTKRDEILEQWRDGALDIVVATSAFGLGIDYSHVRTVIHACLPESLDRFYQEVGRGGRDGRACISILIPSHDDENVARRIAKVKVIGIERGRQRWKAMFDQSVHGQTPRVIDVRLNLPPGSDEADIDMVGERSADWSARTLALMERAGLIQLMGGEVRGDDFDPWQRVRILDQEHLAEATWAQRVEPTRAQITQASWKSIEKMLEFARDQGCASKCFIDLYGESHLGGECSSCRLCRSMPTVRLQRTTVQGSFPWPPLAIADSMRALLDTDGRLVVLYDDKVNSIRFKRRLGECIAALGRAGILNLWLLGDDSEHLGNLVGSLPVGPWCVARGLRLVPAHMPSGPELIVATSGAQFSPLNFSERARGQERVLIVPVQTMAPDRPEVQLRMRHSGRMVMFDEFHRSLMQ